MDGNARIAELLRQGWSLLLMRGIAAIAFGILTFARPGISLAAVVLLFGAYALIDGVLAVWTGISGRHNREYWWVLVLVGVAGVLIGFMTFATPGITALGLLIYIATWAIARGVLEIAAGVRVRKVISGEWRLILAGVASVLFGALLMTHPHDGALAMLWMIALYALVIGVLLVMFSFKARKLGHALAGG
jgi:uncharacterized membrane protein HdeD (DUF308 family)